MGSEIDAELHGPLQRAAEGGQYRDPYARLRAFTAALSDRDYEPATALKITSMSQLIQVLQRLSAM
jgi:hypothetical protein